MARQINPPIRAKRCTAVSLTGRGCSGVAEEMPQSLNDRVLAVPQGAIKPTICLNTLRHDESHALTRISREDRVPCRPWSRALTDTVKSVFQCGGNLLHSPAAPYDNTYNSTSHRTLRRP